MEEKSFEQSLLEYWTTLYIYAYSLTKDQELAKDLVQETMLRALTKRNLFESGTNIKAWLSRILYNLFINEYHRQQRSPVEFNETLTSNYPSFREMKQHCFADSIDIHENIKKLPFKLFCVFEMFVNGYKYTEIAQQLGIPEGTVKNRIFRARKILSQLYS